jgi:ribosomal protein S18 acetylase RimI-like enzyme
VTVATEADLLERGTETLVASWEEYARGAYSASVQHSPGVTVAVFPNEPEQGMYNNALLVRELSAAERRNAIDSMETAYAEAGVTSFAAWVQEGDEEMRRDLERRGYRLDTTTRAMGMTLDEIRSPRPNVELGPSDWPEYLRVLGLPPNFLARADPTAYHILLARLEGKSVAAAMAFDFAGDCGIYNVATLEHAQRRGLGTALTTLHLHDALSRGCATASLQSTAVAERMYAAVGFRHLGRILEYANTER